MKVLPKLLLALLVAVPAASAPLSMSTIEGVYKIQHKIAMYDGSLPPGQFHAVEDVLEIVAVPHGGAYLRIHSIFDNGHICGVHGVAKPEGGALVYRPHDNIEGQCALTLQRKGGNLVLGDKEDACKYDFCGMRGEFDGVGFPLSSRRPIHYMPRLLASREYAEAMSEAGLAAPPPKVAIRLEPMQAVGLYARYPRLSVFPDKAVRAKFNALMAEEESFSRSARNDCAERLSPFDAKAVKVETRVTYVTARYVSVTFSVIGKCRPTFVEVPSTIDLSTVDEVNWQNAFKSGFYESSRGDQDSTLGMLLRARYDSAPVECRKAVENAGALVLWLDAKKGLMVRRQERLPDGCEQAMAFSPDEIAPYAEDARLMADLKATIGH